jgi:hypothetical protein
VAVHPLAGLQPSVVQTFPSLQLGGEPPTQLPALHVSLVVHALLSLQGSVLFVVVQPVAGLQPSVVQTLPSLQVTGAPTQLPLPLHWSLVVHRLLSLQVVPDGAFVPAVQSPLWQVSFPLHTRPSGHDDPFWRRVKPHPIVGLH